MKHTPKYSSACQALINAIQAAETVGASVVIGREVAHNMTTGFKPSEFQLFDIQQAGRDSFTVTFKP